MGAQDDNYGYAEIKVDNANIMAVPRKDAYFDSQLVAAGVHSSQLDFFRDTSAFTVTADAGYGSKIQGRDTNILSRLGTATKGEKFWIFGANMKVTRAGATPRTMNSSVGLTFPDEFRACQDVGYFEWSFAAGAQIFLRRPLRDLPVQIPKPVAFSLSAAATNVLYDMNTPGMLDLRINQRPYALVQQEEMVISLKWQSTDALPTLTTATIYQVHLLGIRVFGQKS